MVKVSLSRCNDYNYNEVKAAVLKSIEKLGGLEKYILKGDKVLLKVNLLMKKPPSYAATTHPTVVRALAEILISYGATVVIGDSPGGPFNEKMLAGIYKTTGMEEIAKLTGATLNSNFKSCEKANPKGVLLKQLTVTDMLNDVDKVISVSKLKTHGMMTFTGAVKNMFGIIPGIMKAEYHLNMPEKPVFADALVDICVCANPVLSFMDAIVGMEGAGPSGGDARNIGAIIASESPYHLDKVACSIINIHFSKVLTIKKSIERGLCSDGLSDIFLLGDEGIDSFKQANFKIPETIEVDFGKKVPKPLRGLVNKHLQPRLIFDESKCIGCKVCINNCPVKVLTMEKGKKIKINSEKCIRCYCCQELCPEKAVTVYRSKLLKFLVSY